MNPPVPGLIALLFLVLTAGCATNGPVPHEPPPPVLTEEQRSRLEFRLHEIRQEMLGLESLPEVQRILGSNTSLETAKLSESDMHNDTIAHYFQLLAQRNRIEQLLR